jgi:hypothetical protein
MYDVLYLNDAKRCSILATGLTREVAMDVARVEARRHNVGRMFIAGSANLPRSNAVLVIRSGPASAAA